MPQKVGMDQEHPARPLRRWVGIDFNSKYLVRRNKEHDPFVEIIRLLAVLKFSPDAPFQRDLVKIQHPTDLTDVCRTLNSLKIDYADERMLRWGQPPQPVELIDRFDALKGFHT